MKRSLITAVTLAVSAVALTACTSEPPRLTEKNENSQATPAPVKPDLDAATKAAGEDFVDAVIAFRKKHRTLPEGSVKQITEYVSDPITGGPLFGVVKLTKFTPRKDGSFTFTLQFDAKNSWNFDSKKVRPKDGGHAEDAKEPSENVELPPWFTPPTDATPSPTAR